MNQLVSLHFAKLLGQHLLGDRRQNFFQLAEAFRSVDQIINDRYLPLTANQLQGIAYGIGALVHSMFFYTSMKKVSTC